MTGIQQRFLRFAAVGLVAASVWALGAGQPVYGQGGAVAYEPIVTGFFDGVALNVTPVVSADRRYVRITANPYFSTLNGFSTYQAPLAAVSGGGIGGGGAGGGIGGAGIGGAGGFAGMNGVVGGMNGATGRQGAASNRMRQSLTANNLSYLAGDFATQVSPSTAGFTSGTDPFDQAVSSATRSAASIGRRFPGQAAIAGEGMRTAPVPQPAFADNLDRSTARQGRATTSRRKAAHRSTRRSTTTTNRHP